MVNKKGVIRIIEVVLSVMIIIGAVVVVLQSKKTDTSGQFCSLLPGIVDEISKNDVIRNYTMHARADLIKTYIENKVKNPAYVFEVKICPPDDPCVLATGGLGNVDICAEQRIISVDEENNLFTPKKLKVFMFRIK